jgi:hypothetical protein
VAQLGARFHGMEEVVGSIPTRSTIIFMTSVYILQSDSSQKFYVGCAGDPDARLTEHQRGQTISTATEGLGASFTRKDSNHPPKHASANGS